MRIEIAGVPLELVCTEKVNEQFFSDYRTDREPIAVIRPTQSDCTKIRQNLEQAARAEGSPVPAFFYYSYLENNAIHALIAEELAAHRVLLLHGSALCVDGQAVIFTAASGTGKSTHARLWRQAFGERVWMINDDKPMLRLEEDRTLVYGTPWDGKHRLSRNACAPLAAIVLLERDKTNHLAPMNRLEAFQLLMRQAYSSASAGTMERILAMEEELVRTVPFFRLGCNMRPEAALVSWRGLVQAGALSAPENGTDR